MTSGDHVVKGKRMVFRCCSARSAPVLRLAHGSEKRFDRVSNPPANHAISTERLLECFKSTHGPRMFRIRFAPMFERRQRGIELSIVFRHRFFYASRIDKTEDCVSIKAYRNANTRQRAAPDARRRRPSPMVRPQAEHRAFRSF